MDPRLTFLATASPPHNLGQDQIMAAADRLFDHRPEALARLLPAFANAGIKERQSVVPLEWLTKPHGWRERQTLYRQGALDLLQEAARRALEGAGLPPEAIDAVVLVSSTGVSAPTLDSFLLDRMPFRRDVVRLPIWGLGCAGGVLGLSRAADLVRAGHAHVLLLVVELCSLTFRREDGGKSNIIAAALFGDGAAGAVLSRDGKGPRLVAAGEWTWPDTQDVMGWTNEDDGFGVLFSRDIPNLVERDFSPAVERFLRAQNLTLADIDAFACHPGGAKVLDALARVLPLGADGIGAARAVLSAHGNMSAPTVLFVLKELLPKAPERVLLSALGPGFTAAFQLLEA